MPDKDLLHLSTCKPPGSPCLVPEIHAAQTSCEEGGCLAPKMSLWIKMKILRVLPVKSFGNDLYNDAFSQTENKIRLKYNTYRGGNFKSWVQRIALNTALDVYKQLTNRVSNLASVRQDIVEECRAEHPDHVARKAELREYINMLDETDAFLIVATHIEGKTLREIAEVIDLSPSWVRNQLAVAEDNLRATLEKFDFDH